jgi:sigma-B regulation protein RsbU (phosphoserine phosphatase)
MLHRQPACLGEESGSIQVSLCVDRQRLHPLVHSLPQRLPRAAIPSGDIAGRRATRPVDISADVQDAALTRGLVNYYPNFARASNAKLVYTILNPGWYNQLAMHLTDKRKYELLYDISQQVRDTLDLDEILSHLLDAVNTVVDYDAAGIFVLNHDLLDEHNVPQQQMIAGISQRGFDPRPHDQDDMLMAGKGIIGHVIFSASSLVAPDVSLNPHYVEGRSRTRSEIAVPIILNERSIGALNLESDHLSAFDDTDLEVLQFFADAASLSIEKAILHRQLLEKRLLDEQLGLARQLQSRLFPQQAPDLAGYDMAGICLPTDEIGGDYYDFIPLPHGRLGVAVADVSGHGIHSALVMTAFRGLLRIHTSGSLGLVKIACAINRQLPEFTGGSQFVTALYSVISPASEELGFVNCGHHPPLLVHPDGTSSILKAHGPALGSWNMPPIPAGSS